MKSLYFIPKIFKAIESCDPNHELEKAFKEILSLGCDTQYRQGLEQFIQFIGAVHDYSLYNAQNLSSIRSADWPPHDGIEIDIERNGACLATVTYRHSKTVRIITNVAPGHFTLKFKIGRVIWSGQLKREDLIWSEAFAGEELRLAAKTEKTAKKASRVIRLLNDEIILQVIPGIEHGNIDILFKGAKIG